ncbi:TonB-dependent receptor plug domain-containing protein [Williamwhitmania taraxaci]|uniref:Iron complex outermembrane recepter protein n=1 Tax=Williamwhitmania taraxaci TaxID=1640674 RepID=A0A1G6KC38_9BACT|nr:TonB-dependent receptor [Williamwhitmania taraxaci]SDC28401.1 iron complex outermembrane recepter protein [Williamwhitmania taraxaci]
MKKGIVVGFVLLVNLGYAQTIVKDTVSLDEVVITGSKIEISRKLVPMSLSQISRQDIENSGQINVLSAMNSYAPGVFVTERNLLGFGVSTGGSGSITIRGVSGSPNTDVLVLIDGHPQYQGIFGHPLPDAYVASDVEKVEIIRGPASILYGSNAMAGVVNIITKKQREDGVTLNLGAAYGSYNTQKYYGTVGYKKKKLSLFASANHDQTDGIRSNTDFVITNSFTKIGYQINRHFDVYADLSLAKFNANDNGPDFKPAPFNIDITRGKTSLSVENRFDKSSGALKVYHNFGTHDLSDGWHSTDRNSGVMLYQTLRVFAKSSITSGVDFKQYGGKGNSGKAKDMLKTVNELAFYTYAQQTLFEKVTFSAGLRIENSSAYGNELIPMAGFSYNPTGNTTFKGSISKGFRSPTIMELYFFAPNPELQPERMISYEISWLQTFFSKRLNVELTAYVEKGNNLIQVVGQFPNVKRENVETFSNQGIEFSATYRFTHNLSLSANYSFLDLDKPVVAAPRQQVNCSVNYRYKIWTVNVSTQHIEKLYTSTTPEITANYTLLNSRVSVNPVKNIDVFVSGNNLLNQKYEINHGYLMPGIYYNVGLNLRF